MNKSIFLIAIGILAGGIASAQTKKVVADKIVGQVGDKIILRSDIANALADLRRQTRGQENVVLPSECEILESQLIRKALVLQAQKDSIQISEDEIEGILDNRIRQFIMSYGSKEVLEEIAGKTVYQIKEDSKEGIREGELSKEMQKKIVDGIKITPSEVKAYYAKIPKDSLPYYESEIEVSQLVVYPKANKDVEEYVSKQLYDYKRQVENGGGSKRFDQLAKSYSEDPAVKENGGQYTLNRNDKNSWDPTFLSAAFKLKDGQVSPVIKSKFGLHILLMVARSGDEAIVKHILRIPPVTDDEIKEAKAHLDSIRRQVVAGTMTFGAAVTKYSDDEGTKYAAGALSGRDAAGNPTNFLTIDQLDKDLTVLLPTLKPGEYSQPQVYVDERNRKMVRIVYLKNRTNPHRENLNEDYNRIAQRALEEKKSSVLEKWFKDHIPTYFISIDKDFGGCKGLNEWRLAAARAQQARGIK
ncbi:peptidylprolyl isomerase [Sediminibacterium soli]|uniref:peptidylprolyl isomerase n=1 Tax=Sediminibacterium soli TaxID=2698829 RepID=UPI00137962AB|nr:peptidylprolyl isomerase [Sediminibacterium soli]NCI45068.1 peptidylprolyl isomerase [Sediminibacterium soli]